MLQPQTLPQNLNQHLHNVCTNRTKKEIKLIRSCIKLNPEENYLGKMVHGFLSHSPREVMYALD